MLDAVHIWLVLHDTHIEHISFYLCIYSLWKSYLTYNNYHKIFFLHVREGGTGHPYFRVSGTLCLSHYGA